MARSQLTVLYDAECGRCTRSARWIERRDHGRGRVVCVPLQGAEPPEGVTRADLERELHAVDVEGHVFAGWDAVVAIARRVRALGWLVPLSHVPGVNRLGHRWYARRAGERACADCVDTPTRARRSRDPSRVDSMPPEG